MEVAAVTAAQCFSSVLPKLAGPLENKIEKTERVSALITFHFLCKITMVQTVHKFLRISPEEDAYFFVEVFFR